MKEKKLKELLTEQSYTIEALEDEIKDLEESLRDEHAKLWEVIQENDRLTMTYEPYRPPGDEHEGLEFYELIDQVEDLEREVAHWKARAMEYMAEVQQVRAAVTELKKAKRPYKPFIKHDRWWSVSVELWPGAWGLNYYRYNWRKYGSTSREGQMQIGPFGVSWNREPKK